MQQDILQTQSVSSSIIRTYNRNIKVVFVFRRIAAIGKQPGSHFEARNLCQEGSPHLFLEGSYALTCLFAHAYIWCSTAPQWNLLKTFLDMEYIYKNLFFANLMVIVRF